MCSDVGQIYPTACLHRDHSILYALVCEIEKSIPRDHRLSSLIKPWMPKGDPRDRFYCPVLTFMMDSYIIVKMSKQLYKGRRESERSK